MGRKRYYSDGAVNQERHQSQKNQTQPDERFGDIVRIEKQNGRATRREKTAIRKGLYNNLVKFLIFFKTE